MQDSLTSDSRDDAGGHRKAGTIQSVSTAATFLRVLANASGPLALGVIAKRAGTSGSMAHRYLQSLVREELAVQDPASGHYDLGPLALGVGVAALGRLDPVELAADAMKDFAARTAASAGVAIWTERGPTLVRWYRSAIFSISSLGLGDVLPLDNTACGLIFQAYLPQDRVASARATQPESFRGSPPTEDRLAEVRASGWLELQGHLLPHVAGQAVPVFDAQGEIACVMTTVANLGDALSSEIGRELSEVAINLSKATAGRVAIGGRS
ncbi:IclR family transcriptional regulator [Allosediminivita pacifica]|uniref:IclR family transcriptional regulator n=1 Tax=Allosediminivita pacifica TaxID=1267769 RepID=A0A2T6A6J9_9RHOB|nr:IclR family transcriptional regulator [Allosediminivita pacifica]PTX39423.1 IclR family transcriptional regulator [Allosediminivita pacifica]GGB27787.1 transcriptional regulator [Allosediminivita pacifica]